MPNAFASAQPGDIVRIIGNGGNDGNLDTLNNNFAYEVGTNAIGGASLSDGTELAVPRGVTVMVEPGTIFKMRSSWIGVGSTSLTIDRSGGALQVLGTPEYNVYFTSWLDETIGRDTHVPKTVPAAGDWGGLVFKADIDNAENRFNLEDEGIFLNYVNHANIGYGGGGNVLIDSIQQVVSPIQMLQTRPTITFNQVHDSADSAMSASPNSFDETNFHAPRYQADGSFTSDYRRVGPDIHGNRLHNNSTNGLFIRIETPVGGSLQPLVVSGRFDDTDITHVLSESLVIQGSQGAPYLDLQRPAVDLVSFTPRTGGVNDFAAGAYQYKITFVDRNGIESRPSVAKTSHACRPGCGHPTQSIASGLRRVHRPAHLPLRRRGRGVPPRRSDQRGGYAVRRCGRGAAGDVPEAATRSARRQCRRGDGGPDAAHFAGTGQLQLPHRVRGQSGPRGCGFRPDADGRGAQLRWRGCGAVNELARRNRRSFARRIYRSTVGGISPYELVAEIDGSSTSYVDDGYTAGGMLDPATMGVVRARPHARLAIDPGTVVKLEGARIETQFGGQLIAEGLAGRPVIFTSRLDDSYGAGGTFDTNNDDGRTSGEDQPRPGDWGGLFFGPLSRGSIDQAYLAYGGGINKIEGTFTGFNVIEVHQADLRLANSVLQYNALGIGGQGPLDRFGRGYNLPATIFVRGAQPVIIDNVIRDNNTSYNASALASARFQMPVITINANSITDQQLPDYGRSTGAIDLATEYRDNRGPLVRGNRLGNNALNGLVVRGEVLTTRSVWDDADIVHVLTNQFDQQDARNGGRVWSFDEVVIPELHTSGGLLLASSPTASLVVKMLSPGQLNNNYNLVDDGEIRNRNAYEGAGFTVGGRPLEMEDRVGGSLYVLGQPGYPVVLTSLHDDSVGAGLQPDDRPQTDTNNNGIASIPRSNDWRSIRIDQDSNDRNVEIAMEMEPANITAPGSNSTTTTAQFLGDLAPNEKAGDEHLRMGFEIHGFLNDRNDVDVYGFTAVGGTEIYLDIDLTTFALDTVVEVLDTNGNVLASSDDTLRNDGVDFVSDQIDPDSVGSLHGTPQYAETHQSGLPKDFFSVNPRDAGMRIALPGGGGSRSAYHIRVRSKDGLSTGLYRLQIRTREADEFPGSTVRFADIRYANNGVEVIGLPRHSPLLGEAAEDEATGSSASNNSFTPDPTTPGNRPQNVGNLLAVDRAAISIAGTVANTFDVDWYRFDTVYEAISDSTPTRQFTGALFDVDYADATVRFNSSMWVFDSTGQLILVGRDSNVADDRSGPLAGNDLGDLSRGSVGPKDPFIGPVELPQGTYYAVVSSNAQVPSELLNNSLVRLEPVNSTRRIAEDHVESSGGSTADAPVVPRLLTLTGSTGPWSITTNRGFDAGHGIAQPFDRTRSAASGLQSYFFDGRDGASGALRSNTFSLKGSSAQDLPVLYFNYFLDSGLTDSFDVFVESGATSRRIASSSAAGFGVTQLQQTTANWLQARLPLDAFAGQENLRLRFVYGSSGAGEGVYLDDVIIGFAERGEMVTGATAGSTDFAFNPGASFGEILERELPAGDPQGGTHRSGRRVWAAATGHDDRHERSAGSADDADRSGRQPDPQRPDVHDRRRRQLPDLRVRGYDGRRRRAARQRRDLLCSGRCRLRDRAAHSRCDQQQSSPDRAENPRRQSGRRSHGQREHRQSRQSVRQRPGGHARCVCHHRNDQRRQSPAGRGRRLGHRPGGQRDVQGQRRVGRLLRRRNQDLWDRVRRRADDRRCPLRRGSEHRRPVHRARFASRRCRLGWRDHARRLPRRVVAGIRLPLRPGCDQRRSVPEPGVRFRGRRDHERQPERYRGGLRGRRGRRSDGHGQSGFGQQGDLRRATPPGTGAFAEEFGYDGFTARIEAQVSGLDINLPHTIKVVISDVGDKVGDSAVFLEAQSLANTRYVRPADGIEVVLHNGDDDQNLFRDQGQVLIHSNTISHSKTFGIVADAGHRESDGTRQSTLFGRSPDCAAARDFDGSAAIFPNNNTIVYDYSTPVPVQLQSPNPGPARNLVEPNDSPAQGGFAPGVVIVNNTISGDGVGGIHVSGDSRVFEMTTKRGAIDIVPPPDPLPANGTAGDSVCDGDRFEITAFGRTVRFEFEDISGSPTDDPTRVCRYGSGTAGGNGWTEGNIPVFYRRTGSGPVHGRTPRDSATSAEPADTASWKWRSRSRMRLTAACWSPTTVRWSFKLMSGRAARRARRRSSAVRGRSGGVCRACFVDGCASLAAHLSVRVQRSAQVSHAYGPQPFARIVNNTIFGNDGTFATYPEAVAEPNDTLDNAIDTRQGPQHNPESFQAAASIGDGQNFRDNASQDVDVYQFQLGIGDHVTIDIDALSLGSKLEPVLRLFNASGEELVLSSGAQGVDPFIDFTATANGTYYVGVSGVGNESYSATSLGGRSVSATTGDYNIAINVRTPRAYVIEVRNGGSYAAGSTFNIEDVTGQTTTFEFVPLGGAPAGSNYPDFLRSRLSPPGDGAVIADAITASPLDNIQNLTNGSFPLANPLRQVTAESYGAITQERLGLQHTDTSPYANPERYVIVRNAARIVDNNSRLRFTPASDGRQDQSLANRGFHDQLLFEHGVLVSEQATPTILNNVLSNLRYGVEQVEFQAGSPGPVDAGAAVPGGMVEGGSIYQHNRINSNIPFGGGDFNISSGQPGAAVRGRQRGQLHPGAVRAVDRQLDRHRTRAE